MKALYLRYCFGKIIEASMYSLAYNRLSNFPVAYRTAGYLACANCYAGYAKTCSRVARCCSRNFAKCRNYVDSTLCQETTAAQLRSYSCFPDRLVILNEDRILSDD